MTQTITIQRLSKNTHIPSSALIKKWIKQSLIDRTTADITIRIINSSESARLNQTYRQKIGPTNILSFSYDIKTAHGDMVLCAPLINKQAREQNKSTKAHWAHLIVHGCLHLLGYDHQTKKEAKEMETLEIKILEKLNVENPYLLKRKNS